ncbi:MAG: hypothetical protein TREMPRED_003452 [Tremellales sp. Tagirdzhanova-0007]|nr:MAG: hypothetical protein TREMPRED_003452 [Tremellales sp. Tagirdzhanova-0007]
MSRPAQPELKKFMDRRLYLHLQGGRELSGVLRGFDMFLNLVMENAFEELGGGVRKPCGMVVSPSSPAASPHVSCSEFWR